jgi:hypothetical protein
VCPCLWVFHWCTPSCYFFYFLFFCFISLECVCSIYSQSPMSNRNVKYFSNVFTAFSHSFYIRLASTWMFFFFFFIINSIVSSSPHRLHFMYVYILLLFHMHTRVYTYNMCVCVYIYIYIYIYIYMHTYTYIYIYIYIYIYTHIYIYNFFTFFFFLIIVLSVHLLINVILFACLLSFLNFTLLYTFNRANKFNL